MSLKKAVNDALIRTTGYQLEKAKPARVAGLRRSGPSSASAKTSTSAGQKAQKAQTSKAETFPKDYDDELVEIIRAVRPYTMTGHDKLHALITATRYIARYKVPGDIVECGVWRGGSMHAVARTLDIAGDRDRDLYLYDTFEGMTEPTEHDVRFDGQSASSQLATQDRLESKVWAYASLEDVQAGFESVPYPSERVHFIKGPVEETVPGQLPEQIAILRLDTDWYESTAHELKHMYDRLVPGGVLMLDDYGWWQGSKLATEEFLDRTGEQLLLVRMGSGRVAVKR